MKRFIISLISVLFFGNFFSLAQSDYEIVQNFKNKYKAIEIAIEFAKDNNDCEQIHSNIMQLKSEFISNKDLLDKSMYPDDFVTMFAKLEKKLEIRKADVSQIVELKQEVTQLNDQLLKLNQENSELLYQIQMIKKSHERDSKTIDSLKNLIKTLRAKIKERDDLILSIVDSLFQTLNIPTQLTDVDAMGVIGKVQSTNLFENLKRSINDNIRFMEVTQLNSGDLSQMRQQQKELNSRWKMIGPKLTQIYLKKNQQANEINQINFLFERWSGQINNQIWEQVNNVFKRKNINLVVFNSGEEFIQSFSNFINDEIKNIGVKDKSESEKIYYTVADTIYFDELKNNWIPFLISNGMMTTEMKDSLDARINRWKAQIAPSTFPMWIIYIGGGMLLVIIILLILNLTKKKQIVYKNVMQDENSNQEKSE